MEKPQRRFCCCFQSLQAQRAGTASGRQGGDATNDNISLDHFVMIRRIGKGSFGQVLEVVHKRTRQVYAAKLLEKDKATGKMLRYTMSERKVLSNIKHTYIVSLHYAFQTKTHLVLVLQYCPGGDLQDLIKRAKRVQEPLARFYSAQVLLALGYLHGEKIVYRDLKPENVVLDERGNAMLTDFGLVKDGVHGPDCAKTFVGSLAFMAPEILRRKPYGHPVDIYGLGVLLFALLTGAPPFYSSKREQLLANIKRAELEIPAHVSVPAAALIQATMKRDPLQRLGAIAGTEEIQGHAFYSDMDWEALQARQLTPPATVAPPRKTSAISHGASLAELLEGGSDGTGANNTALDDWDWNQAEAEQGAPPGSEAPESPKLCDV
jgi:serine/threonine protein kinase